MMAEDAVAKSHKKSILQAEPLCGNHGEDKVNTLTPFICGAVVLISSQFLSRHAGKSAH